MIPFSEFLLTSINDPGLVWIALGAIAQGVEALVVLVSAIFIIFQLRRMRQESIKDRISGLRTAIDVLDTELFRKVAREASTGATIRGVNWDVLLDQLDLVELLIAEKFTDESLFLKLKGDEVRAVAEYLYKNDFMSELQEHPQARHLLERIQAHHG